MPFIIIMWQDIKIGLLFGTETDVKYKIFFENLPQAQEKGLIVNSVLKCSKLGILPEWINNRIPKDISNKLDYLKQTQGRLDTDEIWFQVA